MSGSVAQDEQVRLESRTDNGHVVRDQRSVHEMFQELAAGMCGFSRKVGAPWCIYATIGETIMAVGLRDKRLIHDLIDLSTDNDTAMWREIRRRLGEYAALLK